MDVKPISDEPSLSKQLQLADIAVLAEQGYRSIICNRLDGEGDDLPRFDEIETAAATLGFTVHYLPVIPGQISDDNVANFSKAMRELPKPILAFCRTGVRSASLWTLSQADKLPVSDILSSTQAAGYDMSSVVSRLENGGKNL
jgi:sulfide:quinone oxidoreductase